MVDPTGSASELGYDGDHRLTSFRDPRGFQTNYTVDQAGIYRQIRFADGRTVTFDPSDAQGLANDVAPGQGTVSSPASAPAANPASTVSPEGDLPGALRLDPHGNVLERVDPAGRVLLATRDAHGDPLSVTRPTGQRALFEHDAQGNLTRYEEEAQSSATSFTYDPDLNQLTQVDFPDGTVLRHEYDPAGNLLRTLEPGGAVTEAQYDARGLATVLIVGKGSLVEARTQVAHDPLTGNVLTRTDPLGRVESYLYDQAGNLLVETDRAGFTRRYAWDAAGRVTSVTNERGYTTSFFYDPAGNLESVTDPLARTTRFTHDAMGRVVAVTDPLGRITRFTYTLRGDRAQRIEADGTTTTFTWDEVSRLTAVQDALGQVTRYEYGQGIHVLAAVRPDGTRVSFQRNAWGRVTAVTDARGNTSQLRYDLMGRLVEVEDPLGGVTRREYTATGQLQRFTDQLGRVTQYAYDPLDRLSSMTDPAGGSRHYTRSLTGVVQTETDQLGRTTTYRHDPRDLVTETIDPQGGRILLARDAEGRVVGRTDARGNLTQEVFDGAGQLIRTIYADGRNEQLFRDGAGNVFERQDRAGQRFLYQYDALNRPTQRTLPDGVVIRSAYDLVGRVTRVDGDRGTLTWTYDALGRVTQTTQSHAGGAGTVRYTYDADGNRASLVYPDGYSVLYDHDALSRLTAIREAAGSGGRRLVQYGYDARSRRLTAEHVDGSLVRSSYDVLDRLASLQRELGGSAVDLVSFSRDAVGNVLSKTEPSGRTDYRYNLLDELVEVDDPLGQDEAFVHDLVGNRTASSGPGTSGPGGPGSLAFLAGVLNEYRDISGTGQTHDALGNLTSDGSRSFAYDVENHLTQVERGATTSHYAYDPLGRRAARTVSGPGGTETTGYLYDGAQVLCETDGTGAVLRRFVYGPGLDEPIALQASGRTYTYQRDGLGSVRSLSDETGRIVEEYRLSAYGRVLSARTGPGSSLGAGVDLLDPLGPTAGAPSAIGNPYLFQGRTWDHAAGLYDFRARSFDPARGRFLQLDPAGIWWDPLNRGGGYGFAGNNPLRWADPFGLGATPKSEDAGVIGAFLEGLAEPFKEFQEAFSTIQDFLTRLVNGELELPKLTPDILLGLAKDLLIGVALAVGQSIPFFKGLSVAGKLALTVASVATLGVAGIARAVGRLVAGALLDFFGGKVVGAFGGALKKVGAKLGIGGSHPSTHVGATIGRGGGDAVPPLGGSRSESSVPPFIYREGGAGLSNLKARPGEEALSFRDSLSNPIPKGDRPVFRPGEQYVKLDTSKLPPGSVIQDNVPPGHVSVRATPEELKAAVVDIPRKKSGEPIHPLPENELPRRFPKAE